MMPSLWEVGNSRCARRDRDLRRYLTLKCFQYHPLELIATPGAQSFVGSMSQLLSLEADTRMELHFKPLAATRIDPLAVDTFVLLLGPEVLALDQPEATFLQSHNIVQDALGVATFLVLKRIPYSVRDKRNSLFWGTVLLFDPLSSLFLDAVAAFPTIVEADQMTVRILALDGSHG